MTIYSTPFTNSNKQTTGPSTPQPFSSLDQIVAAMGPQPNYRGVRALIYGEGENRVVFSDFVFRVDDSPKAGV